LITIRLSTSGDCGPKIGKHPPKVSDYSIACIGVYFGRIEDERRTDLTAIPSRHNGLTLSEHVVSAVAHSQSCCRYRSVQYLDRGPGFRHGPYRIMVREGEAGHRRSMRPAEQIQQKGQIAMPEFDRLVILVPPSVAQHNEHDKPTKNERHK
jgi:hypothetical protein